MAFQLVHVAGVYGRVAAHIGPPLADHLLERVPARRRDHRPSVSWQSGGDTGRHRRGRTRPDSAQRRIDQLPLASLARQLRPSLPGDAVVLAPAAAFRDLPPRCDVAETLEVVQHRIQHAIGPLQLTARQLADPFDNCVAVTVAPGQKGQHERRRRGRNEILTELHIERVPYERVPYLASSYMAIIIHGNSMYVIHTSSTSERQVSRRPRRASRPEPIFFIAP